MIRVRIFDKTRMVEFHKLFINEWCAQKYIRKLRYSKKLQVVGEPEYVTREQVNDGKR